MKLGRDAIGKLKLTISTLATIRTHNGKTERAGQRFELMKTSRCFLFRWLALVCAIVSSTDLGEAALPGSVIAWGRNDYGQTNVPNAAQSGVVAIAGGSDFTVALKTNGSVLVWGKSNSGQTNVPLSAQAGVTAVAAGGN